MKAFEVMNPHLLILKHDQPMGRAARMMIKAGANMALVVDKRGQMAGMINKDILLEALTQQMPVDTVLEELNLLPLKTVAWDEDAPPPGEQGEQAIAVIRNNTVAGFLDYAEFARRYAFQEQQRAAELEATIDAVATPLIAVDKEMQINLFNQWAGRILEIDPGDALGRPAASVLTGQKIMEFLCGAEIKPVDKITIDKRSFLVFSKPVIKDGATNGRVLVMRDISEIEEMLHKSEHYRKTNREFKAIIESSFDGLYITDGKANTIILNQGFERIMGITAGQCVGKNMTDLVKEGVFSRSGTLAALEKGERVTITLVSSTGKEALVTSNPIFDDDGNIILVVTNVRDITELNELQRKLEQVQGWREREMEAVIESSFDGLYVTDGEANTLRLNKGFERIMGITAEECVGRNMEELVESGVFSRSGTLAALEKGERVTITLISKNGKEALVTSNPIFDEEGKVVMVVTNVRDITELNELQRRLEHVEGLRQVYEIELQQLKLKNSRHPVMQSAKMKEVLNMVLRVANVDSTVLIQGESGVGKELIAEIIYSSSNRKSGPFIKVNCGAIPENLLESELFGYEPGSFTGASKSGKVGLFELAEGGMLFLDEIGELPLNLQVKLLRALQDKEIVRVGGRESIPVDIRILAGTNRNLMDMVEKKQFRLDLFYRLNVIPIQVPPLRERPDDIPMLVENFLDIFNQKYQMNKRVDQAVMEKFLEYYWPGNVRELENLLERLVVTSSGDLISLWDIPGNFFSNDQGNDSEIELVPLKLAVENTEKKLLQHAFNRYQTTYQVARALKVNQSTVVRKAAKYGIRERH